ncbi:MAG: Clp protease N-terminal domain-containing protein [Acidobacteriota bacterium]
MSDRYTEKLRRAISYARQEALALAAQAIEPEHLLLGLVKEDRAVFLRLLGDTGDLYSEWQQQIATQPVVKIAGAHTDPGLSLVSHKILSYAADEADFVKQRFISTEHLLLGLLRDSQSLVGRLLQLRGLTLMKVREQLRSTDVGDEETAKVGLVNRVGLAVRAFAELLFNKQIITQSEHTVFTNIELSTADQVIAQFQSLIRLLVEKGRLEPEEATKLRSNIAKPEKTNQPLQIGEITGLLHLLLVRLKSKNMLTQQEIDRVFT